MCAGIIAHAQARTAGVVNISEEGQKIFHSRCAACHGLDGRGGDRAPNIASVPRVQHLTSAELVRLISRGIPGTGMPAFRSLGTASVKSVVAYLRVLQGHGKSAALPGNPQRGRLIFFGESGCSECHATAGARGFLGPELSAFARSRTIDEIRAAIQNPNTRKSTVTAIAQDGQQYRGIVRNEDNFSIQLQTPDGSFHLLMKSDLQKLDRNQPSFMPSDYGSRLSPQQMNDLLSYLLNLAGSKSEAPQYED